MNCNYATTVTRSSFVLFRCRVLSVHGYFISRYVHIAPVVLMTALLTDLLMCKASAMMSIDILRCF